MTSIVTYKQAFFPTRSFTCLVRNNIVEKQLSCGPSHLDLFPEISYYFKTLSEFQSVGILAKILLRCIIINFIVLYTSFYFVHP